MQPNDGRVVSTFIVQARSNREITLYGDGSQTRSFCYVTDLLEGVNLLMASSDEFTGPVNLGNPHESSIRELAETILRITGSKSKLTFLPLPADDPRQRQPDISLARNMLGWEPKVTVEDGLRETISYFRHLLAG